MRLSLKKPLLVLLALASIAVSGKAVEFPGPTPGKARVAASSSKYTLGNQVIAISWRLDQGKLLLDQIENKLSGVIYQQDSAPVFVLKTAGSPEGIRDWVIHTPPEKGDAAVNSLSPSIGKHVAGKVLTATLESPSEKISVKWTAELRDDANYVRTTIQILGTDQTTVQRIDLLCNIAAKGDAQTHRSGKNEKGAPILLGQTFFGIEVPFFDSTQANDRINAGFDCALSLETGIPYDFTAVFGVFPEGQARRSLLCYIERERSRSYRPFLHYNCWYDLNKQVSETGMLDSIDTIHSELTEKRGVPVDSYVVDDGYDAADKGFWVFDEEKFPNGFTPLARRLSEINSSLGVWFSPAGGYSDYRDRLENAKKLGIKVPLDLGTPEYYEWCLKFHERLLKEDQVSYLKWDKLGKGVTGHFMGLLRVAEQLRAIRPELFINTTRGTWPSLFWLNHTDCIWRGYNDTGEIGEGPLREKWITWRDGVTYKALKEYYFTYPLNAIMTHGIIRSNVLMGQYNKDDGGMRNDVRSYFAAGYALQELYLAPSFLSDDDWNVIAESALWARKQAPILADAHFIGGDPNELEVYGFAAWQKNQGTLMLRNPAEQPQTCKLDLQTVFELPFDAATAYTLESPYQDQRIIDLEAKAGTPVAIELQPFEVLVFDAASK